MGLSHFPKHAASRGCGPRTYSCPTCGEVNPRMKPSCSGDVVAVSFPFSGSAKNAAGRCLSTRSRFAACQVPSVRLMERGAFTCVDPGRRGVPRCSWPRRTTAAKHRLQRADVRGEAGRTEILNRLNTADMLNSPQKNGSGGHFDPLCPAPTHVELECGGGNPGLSISCLFQTDRSVTHRDQRLSARLHSATQHLIRAPWRCTNK